MVENAQVFSKNVSTSELFRNDFTRSLGGYFPAGSQYYTHVNTLLLYWEEDDLGCQKEVKKLKDLLEHHFRYAVYIFVIPTRRSQALLQQEISKFVLEHSLESTLTIIYYSGHGDPDDETDERLRKLILAAKEDGGPTLRWSDVQPALGAADGDVLLLLDCCHASLAVRSLRSPDLEVLAACAMNLTTTGVGKRSFTSAMISELKEVSRSNRSVSASALHRWLSSDLAGLSESPFHFGSSKSHGGSIVLQPLPQPSVSKPISIRPRDSVASVTLKVQFLEDPEVKQLVAWVKAAAPSSVASIDIEKAVFQRQQLQRFLIQGEDINLKEDSLLDSADEGGQAALLKTLSAVEQVKPPGEDSLNRQLEDTGVATDICETLKKSNQSLFCSIRELLFSLPTFRKTEALAILERSKLAQDTGLSNSAAVMMILNNTEGCTSARQVEVETLSIGETKHGLAHGTIDGQEVLIEYKEASQDSSGWVPKDTAERIRQLASLCSAQSSDEFRMFPFKGYFEDYAKSRTGFVYSFPEHHHGASSIIPLLNCIPLTPGIGRPALGQRFKLAQNIAQAVYCFHCHGWVHKNLRSENILFLQEKEYQEPWLFGVEYSRLESDFSSRRNNWNIERNIYRHPERWGRPSVPAKKVHDIYALGVILLEIGLWQRAITLSLDTNHGFRLCKRGETVQSQLREQTQARLGYTMGEKYQRIVLMCLEGREIAFGVEADNKNDSKLLRTFREQVLDVLGLAGDAV